MIKILLSDTEKKVGFKIKTRGDCERLGDLIFQSTEILLSYNTLRRLFNLDKKKVVPRNSTLDVLARFNGFSNFNDFILSRPFQASWKRSNRIYELIYLDSEQDLLRAIESGMEVPSEFLEFLPSVLRELIISGRTDLLNKIFELKCFRFENFEFSELVHLSSALGLLFRKMFTLDNRLLANENFLETVYSMFVDYSSLNQYYGTWSLLVANSDIKGEMAIFSKCILQLKNFLNKQVVEYPFDPEMSIEMLHPILQSRLVSLRIIDNRKINLNELMTNYLNHVRLDQHTLLDYFYELIITSMLLRDFRLMEIIQQKLSLYKPPSIYYLQLHHNYLNLMLLLLSHFKAKQKDVSKYLSRIDFESFRSSYKEICQLFFFIFTYHTEIGKKRLIALERYSELSQKLNYSIFDVDYLNGYFQK